MFICDRQIESKSTTCNRCREIRGGAGCRADCNGLSRDLLPQVPRDVVLWIGRPCAIQCDRAERVHGLRRARIGAGRRVGKVSDNDDTGSTVASGGAIIDPIDVAATSAAAIPIQTIVAGDTIIAGCATTACAAQIGRNPIAPDIAASGATPTIIHQRSGYV